MKRSRKRKKKYDDDEPQLETVAPEKKFDDSIIKWFFLVGFLDMFAVSLVVPALPIYARSLGMTNTQIGALISVYGALQCISSPFIGRWSDFQGRKIALVSSLFLTGFSYLILGFSAIKGGIVIFIFGRVLAGLFKHDQTLVRAYFAAVMSKEEGAIAFSHFTATSNVGFILGPIIGGRLAESNSGFFLICVQAALLFVITAVMIIYLIPPAESKDDRLQEKTKSKGFFNFLYEIDYDKLWDAFLIKFLATFSTALYRENFVLILNEKYAIGTKTSGFILSYQALINVIAGFLVAPLMLYFGIPVLLFYSATILFATLFCLTFLEGLWLVLCLLIPLGFASAVMRNGMTELLISRVNQNEVGTVMGLGQSIMSFSRMLAPFISGFLLDRNVNGPAAIATIFAIATVVVSLYIIYNQPSEDRPKEKENELNDEEAFHVREMEEFLKTI